EQEHAAARTGQRPLQCRPGCIAEGRPGRSATDAAALGHLRCAAAPERREVADRKGHRTMKSRNARDSKKAPTKNPPAKSTGRQQEAASGAGGQYGEGNYAATRQYNKGVKEHMEHHDVEREARDAAPRN